MKNKLVLFLIILSVFASCVSMKKDSSEKISFNGVYPHLAYYNNEGECGTGAVVSWGNDLWVITYGPHQPYGSSDKLYQITSDLEQIIREESIGGTPANRMIHQESNQLFIGPYAIDDKGNVRVIPYTAMPGRHTGNARHMTVPANKIYYATMEEGFYEVDVKTLEVTTVFEDANLSRKKGEMAQYGALLPGAHGKGLYSGQGVLVYSNNGEASREALERFDVESGSLSEWDGKIWKVVRRNQFTEVTGPGGIYGNCNPATDPIWTIGWDHKSLILGVRSPKIGWRFFRLPKASYSYDGAHGWNTEWPRIRNIGTTSKPDYLMTMHGMFWKFPADFSAEQTAGIRPRSSYLKVIGDFTRWNDRLVFGCDDSAKKEFLNKRKVKGSIKGAGQSNSNLWFVDFDTPDNLGTTTVSGYVWLNDTVNAGEVSEAFLFSGWDYRSSWIKNDGQSAVEFTFEIDKEGTNNWTKLRSVEALPQTAVYIPFDKKEQGEWIRVKVDKNTQASVAFNYSEKDCRGYMNDEIFEGMAGIGHDKSFGGLLYALGDNRHNLALLANNESGEIGYYELNGEMQLVAKNDLAMVGFIHENFAIPEQTVEIESGSVLIIDDHNRRWRLPLTDKKYDKKTLEGKVRLCREVVTERDLFNCHGTFYELPAKNADGFAKIRPISTHGLGINDYASYRGLLVMTGISPSEIKNNKRIIMSEDKKAAVWVGTIDDLWKLGKPIGKGGPWIHTAVKVNQVSDPYLIGFYDNRRLSLSHQSNEDITFSVEVDPTGDGCWMPYKKLTVSPNKTVNYTFPEEFHARWIRFSVNRPATVTTLLDYE